MKAIIKPLLGNGKKVLSNGADVVAKNGKNGKNGLNGNGNGLASSYAREQRALSKANASTPVQETEIFVPTNNLAKEQAVDNHLAKRRGSINVAMPIEELKEIQSIKEENSRITVDFGKIKLDLIMLKARLMEVEKLESDMEAKFKGNMTKEKKMLDKLNKKYGEGSVDLANGIFTPTATDNGEGKR